MKTRQIQCTPSCPLPPLFSLSHTHTLPLHVPVNGEITTLRRLDSHFTIQHAIDDTPSALSPSSLGAYTHRKQTRSPAQTQRSATMHAYMHSPGYQRRGRGRGAGRPKAKDKAGKDQGDVYLLGGHRRREGRQWTKGHHLGGRRRTALRVSSTKVCKLTAGLVGLSVPVCSINSCSCHSCLYRDDLIVAPCVCLFLRILIQDCPGEWQLGHLGRRMEEVGIDE
jgi:hypothetical protein